MQTEYEREHEVKMFQASAEETDSDSSDSNCNLSMMKSEVLELRRALEKLRLERRFAEKELMEMQDSIDAAEKNLKECELQRSILAHTAQEMTSDLAEKDAWIDELKKDLSEMQKLHQGEKRRITSNELLISQLRSEKENMVQHSKSHSSADVQRLQSHADTLEAEVIFLRHELNQTQQELAWERKSLNSMGTSLAADMTDDGLARPIESELNRKIVRDVDCQTEKKVGIIESPLQKRVVHQHTADMNMKITILLCCIWVCFEIYLSTTTAFSTTLRPSPLT
jgi:chromosome segregation ATPase